MKSGNVIRDNRSKWGERKEGIHNQMFGRRREENSEEKIIKEGS